jgi:hypothetical protein
VNLNIAIKRKFRSIMINKHMSCYKLAICILWTIATIWPVTAVAEKTWYFNWYCPGCSKIGGRTTGTEGPFPSESACESARSRMRSSMSSMGGGVTTASCYSTGWDTETPSSRTRPSTPGQPYYTPPSDDYESERRQQEEFESQQREEAERERKRKEEAERERQRQEEFIRERDKAVESLKGSGSGAFGIKGSPTGDLQIKALAPDRERRDVSTAWRQLYCASTIALSAISAARKDPPDIEEVRYLGEEVVKALNGDRMGVACPEKVPNPPEPYGKKKLENSTLLQFYSTLLQATSKQAQRVAEINKQIRELKLQFEEKTVLIRQLDQPISASVVDLRNAKGDVVDLSVVSGGQPFRTKSDKPGIDQIVVPLPPITIGSDRSLWLQLAPRFRYFMEMEDLRDRYVKGYTIIEEVRRNLALQALRAQAGIGQKPMPFAQQRVDLWFEQEVNRARDRILKEEEQAIQAARRRSLETMINEVSRVQKEKAVRDRQTDEALLEFTKAQKRILKEEEAAIQEAQRRSLTGMIEAIRRMKEQGLYKENDDLLQKGQTDPRFRQALGQAHDRILKQEEEAVQTAHRQMLKSIQKELGRVLEQGHDNLVADYLDNETLKTARERILGQEEQAIQRARGRSIEKLTGKIGLLQQQRGQKLKQEQAALSETEKLISQSQAGKQQATSKLEQYRSFAQKVANDPTQAPELTVQIK